MTCEENGRFFLHPEERNRLLLVKDLDREMETLFIDLLVILYSYSTKTGKIVRASSNNSRSDRSHVLWTL